MASCQDRITTVLSNPGSYGNKISIALAHQEHFNPGTVTAPPSDYSGDITDYRRCLEAMYQAFTAAGVRCDASIFDCPGIIDPVATVQGFTALAQRGVLDDPRGLVSEPISSPVAIPAANLSTGATMGTSLIPFAGSSVVVGPSAGGSSPSLLLGPLDDVLRTVGGIVGGPVGGIINTLLPPKAPAPVGGMIPGLTASCPDGFRVDANGRCVKDSTIGAIQRILPGGQTGTLADVQGTPVAGAFGIPGYLPSQVGTINGNPILRCPTGFVLGKDDVCYVKGVIPRKFRKWAPASRPPVTAGDARAIRQAASAKRKVKRLAGDVGYSCAAKGSRRK